MSKTNTHLPHTQVWICTAVFSLPQNSTQLSKAKYKVTNHAQISDAKFMSLPKCCANIKSQVSVAAKSLLKYQKPSLQNACWWGNTPALVVNPGAIGNLAASALAGNRFQSVNCMSFPYTTPCHHHQSLFYDSILCMAYNQVIIGIEWRFHCTHLSVTRVSLSRQQVPICELHEFPPRQRLVINIKVFSTLNGITVGDLELNDDVSLLI